MVMNHARQAIRLGLVALFILAGTPLRGAAQSTTTLTEAPTVPPPITRKQPAHLVVHVEVKEMVKRLADGVQYRFWTFGGSVPGKFIRVREGDQVEIHLENHPGNHFAHNIDLHAATGPGGGASASIVLPGHASVFQFKALN